MYIYKKKKQQGSFLFELMVGLLISVIVVLGVFVIYSKFEGYKRTTTNISQSIGNASIGMFALEKNGRNAGFGINNINFMGCTVNAFNSTTNSSYTFPLSPIVIESSNSNKVSDEFFLLYGNAVNFFAPVRLTNNMANRTDTLYLESRFGSRAGEVFIVGQPSRNCSLGQISDTPGNGNSTIEHNNSSYNNGLNTTKFNNASGLANLHTAQALFLNLGNNPKRLHYFVDNNQLIQDNIFDNQHDETVLADNIVLLKAQYALDTDDDNNVDTWSSATLNSANYNQILGFRVAMLVQSPQKEKVCNVTSNPVFEWQGGELDVSDIPDYGCYRYRVIQSTIPFKNIMFKN